MAAHRGTADARRAQRDGLQSELAQAGQQVARLSPRALREHVAAQLAEWRGLLAEPTQARAVLKALLDGGRFTFRPLKSGGCEITAALTYTSALARAGANSVVAPTGFEPVFQP